MALQTRGLHHVTAIAGDPQQNADFYVGTLGLRLVKRTVNHDDRGTYHFYFGDRAGTPGTNITFFPWTERGRRGEFGAGQVAETAYAIDPDSVEYWVARLESEEVAVEREERFGETVLGFEDPDGIGLELVATDRETRSRPWEEGPVPTDHQLRGFYGVTIAVDDLEPTASVLVDVLGYDREAEHDEVSEMRSGDEGTATREAERKRRRYRSGPGGPGSVVDLVETDAGRGQMGVGTVHHVAFAAADVEEQERWRAAYSDHGLDPTGVIDRTYFQSVYVREPGGVLFEMATPEPGFTADEDLDELGTALVLPERLEDERDSIETQLPAFDGPVVGDG